MATTDFDNLQKCFDWEQIGCPQFDKILWHNFKTDEYECGGKIISPTDKRLIEYLEMRKTLIPSGLT